MFFLCGIVIINFQAPVSPPRRREEERDRRKETHVREWDIGKEELNRNRDRSKSRDRHDRKRHTHRSTTPLDGIYFSL